MRIRVCACCLAVISLTICHAYAMPLHEKATLFQHDMEKRFLLEGQALCKLKRPTERRSFVAYNMPDNAYMTGIYTATLAMKYAVTRKENDLKAARHSLNALHLLCAVSGTPGVPARAAWPKGKSLDDDGIWRDSSCGRYVWRGDVSTDQVAGIMFGFAFAYYRIADKTTRENIARDATAIVDRVLNHDLRIVDVDGKPTRWGRYDPRYVSKTEKMNALLWLQALKVAAQVSDTSRYADLYAHWAVDKGYAELAAAARRKAAPLFRGMVNHSDDVLLFLGFVPLLRYETDPEIRSLIMSGLRHFWEGEKQFPGVKQEGNPLYAFAAATFLEDPSGVEDGINALRWFPLDIKWNKDTISNYETEFGFHWESTVQSPVPGPNAALPIDRREKTWSTWVQDPYYSAGNRTQDTAMEYNGHDYLLAYWLGRFHNFLNAEE